MAPDVPDEPLLLEDFLRCPEWHQRAACRGVGPDVFFLEHGTTDTYDAARDLCALCPVREQCLETALADQSPLGMWAATTPKERPEMRRGQVA